MFSKLFYILFCFSISRWSFSPTFCFRLIAFSIWSLMLFFCFSMRVNCRTFFSISHFCFYVLSSFISSIFPYETGWVLFTVRFPALFGVGGSWVGDGEVWVEAVGSWVRAGEVWAGTGVYWVRAGNVWAGTGVYWDVAGKRWVGTCKY